MKVINEKEFNELMKENKVVLVDFFATWCGPCRMLSPILEEVSEASNGEYEVVKVDVERNLILIKGSMPGAKNSILKIQSAVKA